MPLTTKDFHGDVSDCKVNVVFSEGFLEGELDALTCEYIRKFGLAAAHSWRDGLTCSRTLGKRLAGLLTAPQSFIRGQRSALAFSRLSHRQSDCLAAPANRQTITLEGSDQTTAVASDFPSEIFRRLTGLIAPVKITEICEHEFCGHVYNLQTDTGYYLANSIVTHNCVCAVAGARAPL
jgi:hypothetical protein